MVEVEDMDFSQTYQDKLAEEYADEVVEIIGEEKDFSPVMGSNTVYVKTTGYVLRKNELAIESKGPEIRYNEEIVSPGDVYDAMEEIGENHVTKEDISELLEQTE